MILNPEKANIKLKSLLFLHEIKSIFDDFGISDSKKTFNDESADDGP